MTPELAELLKEIVAALYREMGSGWCSEKIEQIDKLLTPQTQNQ